MKIDQCCQRQRCKHVELEQFWRVSASRGFVSDSWAFLYYSIMTTVGRWGLLPIGALFRVSAFHDYISLFSTTFRTKLMRNWDKMKCVRLSREMRETWLAGCSPLRIPHRRQSYGKSFCGRDRLTPICIQFRNLRTNQRNQKKQLRRWHSKIPLKTFRIMMQLMSQFMIFA